MRFLLELAFSLKTNLFAEGTHFVSIHLPNVEKKHIVKGEWSKTISKLYTTLWDISISKINKLFINSTYDRIEFWDGAVYQYRAVGHASKWNISEPNNVSVCVHPDPNSQGGGRPQTHSRLVGGNNPRTWMHIPPSPADLVVHVVSLISTQERWPFACKERKDICIHTDKTKQWHHPLATHSWNKKNP